MSKIVRPVLTLCLIFFLHVTVIIFVLPSKVKLFFRSTLMNQLNKIGLLLNPELILLWMKVSIILFVTSCKRYVYLVMTEVKILVRILGM